MYCLHMHYPAGSTRDTSRSKSLISTSELSESSELSKQLTESVNEATSSSDSAFHQVRVWAEADEVVVVGAAAGCCMCQRCAWPPRVNGQAGLWQGCCGMPACTGDAQLHGPSPVELAPCMHALRCVMWQVMTERSSTISQDVTNGKESTRGTEFSYTVSTVSGPLSFRNHTA